MTDSDGSGFQETKDLTTSTTNPIRQPRWMKRLMNLMKKSLMMTLWTFRLKRKDFSGEAAAAKGEDTLSSVHVVAFSPLLLKKKDNKNSSNPRCKSWKTGKTSPQTKRNGSGSED
ncbi:hypothetical protein WMY93_001748 [Mugilogobius chulae]|uniref:Uncharacterized protein n=1 Tax=Mugilogobius chulae TaxID=88201 RepID=A0AAW0Q1F2_9GOBI